MKKHIAFTDPKDLEWFHSLAEEPKKEMFHEPIIYDNIEDDPSNINIDEDEMENWIKENGLIDEDEYAVLRKKTLGL